MRKFASLTNQRGSLMPQTWPEARDNYWAKLFANAYYILCLLLWRLTRLTTWGHCQTRLLERNSGQQRTLTAKCDEPESFLVPHMDEVIASLWEAHIILTIDAKYGYCQVEIDKRNRKWPPLQVVTACTSVYDSRLDWKTDLPPFQDHCTVFYFSWSSSQLLSTYTILLSLSEF